MPLPTSPVDICNMSGDLLRERAISVISPPVTETEKIYARHYDEVRQWLLYQGVWNFAYRVVEIDRTSTPAGDFADAYLLPTNCLRLLSVGDATFRGQTKYEVRGREIVIDNDGEAALLVRYIEDVTDVTTWSAGYRKLMILLLAEQVGYAITGKEKPIERLEALIKAAWKDAFSIDGQESPPTRIERSRLLTARRLNSANVASRYTSFDT